MHPQLGSLLADGGFIVAAHHPRLASALNRAVRAGDLQRLLPGILVPAGEPALGTRLRAAAAWSAPAGVIHAHTAVSLWQRSRLDAAVHIAHPSLRSRPGVVVTHRLIPPEFVRVASGVPVATPAFAAVEIAALDDGSAVCDAKRLGLATQSEIEAALGALSGSNGQQRRTEAVLAARRNAWSYGELRLHRILVAGGITDWVANQAITCAGRTVIPDLRFRHVRLVVEFDGRETHAGTAAFLRDRERLNLLGAAGFRVLRFGWEHLDQPDYIVRTVLAALAAD